MSKRCQKVVKKLSKSCQKVVKQLSNSCQKVVKKLSKKVVTIGPSNPKLEKPENLKEATTNRGVLDAEERRSDQEWTMKNGR
jgi:hypothetical protein